MHEDHLLSFGQLKHCVSIMLKCQEYFVADGSLICLYCYFLTEKELGFSASNNEKYAQYAHDINCGISEIVFLVSIYMP